MTMTDIDIYDPAVYGTAGIPHETLARLRREAPVSRQPDPQQPNGYWAVVGYDDIVFVSRNPQLFSSHERTCLLDELDPEALAQQQLMMVNLDPPEHTRLRSLVNRGFTPRMIGRLTDRITAAAERIVDDAVRLGSGDFVQMCAAELPLVVIAELLGVLHEHRHRLFDWTNRMVSSADPGFKGVEDAHQAFVEVFAYANELGAQKRGCPADDIVSKLISVDDDGNQLSELEFDLFFLLLIVAGNETTRNSISGGMLAFHEYPEQWRRLKADPSLASTAAEEAVRWVSPLNTFRRTAMDDVELGGEMIRRGDKVVVFYSSANRDDSVFTDPYVFDIGRDPNPHVGFGGGGPHFCLGRHLARLELEIMFRTLAERTERVEVVGDVRRLHSQFLNGIISMPVRFTPAA